MGNLQATIVADLGFGDNGKGETVNRYCQRQPNSVVIRYHGGSQAAHNVVLPDGRHHTFSQFGSGSFVPGVRTHLSRFMLIDPATMANEAKHLWQLTGRNPYDLLTIDERALVVTPFHKAANRIREFLRGSGRHGSCGMGIGETARDALSWPNQALRAGQLRSTQTITEAFTFFQALKHNEFEPQLETLSHHQLLSDDAKLLSDVGIIPWLVQTYQRLAGQMTFVSENHLRLLAAEYNLVFEGAQGVLLDRQVGFCPHVTQSTTTTANALTLLDEIGYRQPITRIGVLRTYHTRHGAGPFPTEDSNLTATMPDLHNGTGKWQGIFRVGYFDAVLARYALAATNGVDGLALTHLDRIPLPGQLCTSYRLSSGEELINMAVPTTREEQERVTKLVQSATPQYRTVSVDPDEYAKEIERELGVPIISRSFGPAAVNENRHSA